MEQYIPYSLLCDLFSINLETYLHIYLNTQVYINLKFIALRRFFELKQHIYLWAY